VRLAPSGGACQREDLRNHDEDNDVTDINKTHDPHLRSWVPSANTPEHDFPIQNLPVGVFSQDGGAARAGIAIGDEILDIAACVEQGLFSGLALTAARAAGQPTLNAFMAQGKDASAALRQAASDILGAHRADEMKTLNAQRPILVSTSQARMHLPCHTRNYTDFLTSAYHTERHGRLKGLDVPLPPAFKSLPVAYHGRASSICVSGTSVRRPWGQWRDPDGQVRFGPTEALDFELEMAAIVGQGNELGRPIKLDDARSHIFGYCLLNDWSAKSIQWWEQVLGPFLGKSFGTLVSPWVVMEEALIPFRCQGPARGADDPETLAHLSSSTNDQAGGLSVFLQASLLTEQMRARQLGAERIAATRLSHLYWSFPQMLTHHASNGCNLETGDLMGSGTISGPDDESMACLTEKTSAGRNALQLSNGEQRRWLEDGDEVILTAKAQRDGYVSIGFGECRGRIEGALPA